MPWPAFILLGFAFGSIPFGLLIARFRGVDIRRHGSGNIGATNVARVLGPRLGLLCFVLDVAKGLVPTLAAGGAHGLLQASVFARPISTEHAWWWLSVVAACILGHVFSPFVGFRGGKGVATGLGAMLGLWPYLALPALGALILWIAVAAAWRYVSLASCTAALSLPAWIFLGSRIAADPALDMMPFYTFAVAMSLLVIIRHRANIRRLLAGTENRMGAPRRP